MSAPNGTTGGHTRTRKPRPESGECPICRHKFATGTTGWYSHVITVANHPTWHPDTPDATERKNLFIAEFPEFFRDAWTPSRRHPTPSSMPAGGGAAAARFCSACGAEAAGEGRFCWACGTALAAAIPRPGSMPPKAK